MYVHVIIVTYHTFMSVFISFAVAVSVPAMTQQTVSITAQEITKLQVPPTLVPPKSETPSQAPAGDCELTVMIVYKSYV